MNWNELLSLTVLVILTENVVLVRLLGVTPFLSVSGRMSTALGMGATVTLLMAISSLSAWAVNTYLLIPFALDGYLQTLTFLLIVALWAWLLRLLIRSALPSLYALLSADLPLLAINCAVLGSLLLGAREEGFGPLDATLYGILCALSFMLALVLLACVRERLKLCRCPKAFEGLPIALISAGLLAMAFMGFSGLRLG